MSKMKQFLRVNYKGILLGIIIGGLIFGTSVYAITVAGNTVTYDNTSSGLTSTNVQSAIDELYTKSSSLKTSYDDMRNTLGLYRNTNSNIIKVMSYDETADSTTYCILGTEETCQELAPTKETVYAPGTIIEYMVNNNTKRTFYVLHDDGGTLTLQDQKNVVERTAYTTKAAFIAAGGTESEWNSCTYTSGSTTYYGCSTRGPLTILPALEDATDTWTNVNLQTYTPGTTSFAGNSYTGCTTSACAATTYSMPERSGRARLITVPEAWATGCQTYANKSCPKYMYNYLKEANNYEGIIDGTEGVWGYWTMNARSDLSANAWNVHSYGHVTDRLVGSTDYGARPVVVINK